VKAPEGAPNVLIVLIDDAGFGGPAGRNHHRVGMGTIAELPGPFPGHTGVKPKSVAALPRILKENGYVTGGSASGT
jgi:arylsulfatase A-like enzyme